MILITHSVRIIRVFFDTEIGRKRYLRHDDDEKIRSRPKSRKCKNRIYSNYLLCRRPTYPRGRLPVPRSIFIIIIAVQMKSRETINNDDGTRAATRLPGAGSDLHKSRQFRAARST